MTYDAAGRMKTQAQPNGITLTFGYDKNGNRTLVQDSFGGKVESVYDRDNRLISRRMSGDGQKLRIDLTYTPDNKIATETRFGDLVGIEKLGFSTYIYDDAGRLTNIQHQDGSGGIIADYVYVYDAANRLISKTENGVVTNYNYDDLNQLTGDGPRSFSYDPTGNRTNPGYQTGPGNRLITDGEWNYFHDLEGNVVKRVNIATGRTWTHEYDHLNHMTRAEERVSDGGSLIQRVSFEYDVFNNRIEKQAFNVPANTLQVDRFAYDGQEVWTDLNAANRVKRRYMRGDQVDQLYARTGPGNKQAAWYFTDHLGTIRDIMDLKDRVRDHIDYDAFGNILLETNANFGDRYKYTGREYIRELDLYDNRERFRYARTNLFFSEDKMPDPAANLYPYVKNSPTNFTDPNGLEPIKFAHPDALKKIKLSEKEKELLDDYWAKLTPTQQATVNKTINSPEIINHSYYLQTLNPDKKFTWELIRSDPVVLSDWQVDILLRSASTWKTEELRKQHEEAMARLKVTWRQVLAFIAKDLANYQIDLKYFSRGFLVGLAEEGWEMIKGLGKTVVEAVEDPTGIKRAIKTIQGIMKFAEFVKENDPDDVAELLFPGLHSFLMPEIKDLESREARSNWQYRRGKFAGKFAAYFVSSVVGDKLIGYMGKLIKEVRRLRALDKTLSKEKALDQALNTIERPHDVPKFERKPLQVESQPVVKSPLGPFCFAAGTPLLTPVGERPIETFRPGDLILSRSEHDPEGLAEAKVVEEVFVQSAYVIHVHVAGQVVRTTAAHPFFVVGKNWTPAGLLQAGDRLLGHDERTAVVEDIFDTGEYETVYNMRVEDFHTYFVGSREWGFSIWAHNTCTQQQVRDLLDILGAGKADTRIVKEITDLANKGEKDKLIAKLTELSERSSGKFPKENVKPIAEQLLGEKAPKAVPKVNKAINSDIAHAAERAVERGVFPDKKSAADALRDLSKKITSDGLPPGTIPDPKRADSVLVPFGNGFAVYEIKKNGTAILRTVLGGGI